MGSCDPERGRERERERERESVNCMFVHYLLSLSASGASSNKCMTKLIASVLTLNRAKPYSNIDCSTEITK